MTGTELVKNQYRINDNDNDNDENDNSVNNNTLSSQTSNNNLILLQRFEWPKDYN